MQFFVGWVIFSWLGESFSNSGSMITALGYIVGLLVGWFTANYSIRTNKAKA